MNEVCAHSSLRQQIDAFGVTIHEQAGAARFFDAHTIETKGGNDWIDPAKLEKEGNHQ